MLITRKCITDTSGGLRTNHAKPVTKFTDFYIICFWWKKIDKRLAEKDDKKDTTFIKFSFINCLTNSWHLDLFMEQTSKQRKPL